MYNREAVHEDTRTPKSREFKVFDSTLNIKWLSVDFASDPDYVGIPERYLECGVQYMACEDPEAISIRTSSRISDLCQGLSALHEQLCMADKVAACPQVEAIVISSIENDKDKQEYIEFRRKMFAVLVADNPINIDFANSLDYLQRL
jgi:hypothetical protein